VINDTIAPPTKPTPKPVATSSLFGVISISTVGTAAAVWVEQEAPQFGALTRIKDTAGRYMLLPKPNYQGAEVREYLEAGGAALGHQNAMPPPSEELRIAAAVTAERLRCAAIAAEQYRHKSTDPLWTGAGEDEKTAYWIEQAILEGGDVGTYDGTRVQDEATP